MGGILLIQTILVRLTTGNINLNFWFSYIILIIIVGGLLVLFTYITRIASNELFKPKNYIITLITIILILSYYPLKKFLILFNNNFNNNEFILWAYNFDFNQLINKFFNFPSIAILYFIILYLLITLIAIVKITNISYGPLRKKN